MNAYKVIDKDIIEFKDEALKFFDYIQLQNFKNNDNFIKRPFCYYMSYDFVKEHGLNIDKIKNKSEYFTGDFRFFMTGPDHVEGLVAHLDNFADGISPGTINLYLKNCDNTVPTKWWKIKSGTPRWVENKGGQLNSRVAGNKSPRFPNQGEFEVIEEKCFYNGDAVLFRTSRWHSVHNETNKNRIICSFMLNSLMVWEDIVDNFKTKGIIE